MSSSKVFDQEAERYDLWYERNKPIYLSELEAVRLFRCEKAVEIGVGTGRFSMRVGAIAGIDPSIRMLKHAPETIHRIQAVGEHLPFRSKIFDCALLIITLCFTDDPQKVLAEALRVSKRIVICIVPRESAWGRLYQKLGRDGNPFYSHAHFYSVKEIIELGSRLGLRPRRLISTLSYPPGEKRFEKPREVTLEEAEKFGFTCIELVKE